MACVYCNMDLHDICLDTSDKEDCCCGGVGFVEDNPFTSKPRVTGGNIKEGFEMADVLSSGRKRAAELMPTESFGICEWAGLRYAGGGVYPIIGCDGTRYTAHRHHGPNKSTLFNERRTNLHGVCHYCHNRWHELNDPTYDEPRPEGGAAWFPRESAGECRDHDPDTKATEEEIAAYAIWWKLDPEIRGNSFEWKAKNEAPAQ